MKVAIVHEWLEKYAGSERVLEQMITCFPDAEVFAVADFLKPGERRFLQGRPVRTSFVQRLPFVRKYFRALLPFMPLAMEQFDLSAYDLVLSSNHAVAKGILTGPYQVHVSYIHSPMRYAWDQQAQYLRQAGLHRGLRSICARSFLHYLRGWDLNAASRVDYFIANSHFIAERIYKVYRRDSTVVYPPVDVEAFCPGEKPGDTYLAVSRFVPYKRVDLIVRAFAAMPERRLLVVGTGPESKRIVEAAGRAPNIEFVETLPRGQLVLALQRARAFVFAGEEDFGITLVEAQACGTPVIAFARGGAAEIVRDGLTGVLFSEQTVTSVIEAVNRFEAIENKLCRTACTNNAMRFNVARFRRELCDAVNFAFRTRSGSRGLPQLQLSEAVQM